MKYERNSKVKSQKGRGFNAEAQSIVEVEVSDRVWEIAAFVLFVSFVDQYFNKEHKVTK